jgi:zinc transporter ZupT
MENLVLPALLCAVAFALVHFITPRLHFIEAVPRSRWLSFAGGVAVAYVFMHLLPELAEHERALAGEHEGAEGGEGGLIVYALALAGLSAFYGLERIVKTSRAASTSHPAERGHPDEEPHAAAGFWLHVGSFAIYNTLIGYLLLHREDAGLVALLLYTVAMGLHFFTNDFGLHQDYARLYDRAGRWLLAGAVLLGWLLGVLVELPEVALIAVFAFLAGGVVLNVLKEELPEERKSSLLPFLIGVGGYGALLSVL